MIILYINNEYCKSLTQLREYFGQISSPQNELFWDLISTGRDQIISAWLQDQGETELAKQLENIDTNLGDTQYFAKMKSIILEKEDIEIPQKTDFSQCFSLESIDQEEDYQGALIRVKFKVLLSVNESYEIKAKTSWGVRALYINPFNVSEGDYITESFHFRKYPGKDFEVIGLFADGEEVVTQIVKGEPIPKAALSAVIASLATHLANKELRNTASDDDFVDLGLSVKWAKCNLGAKSPEEYGNYYAWGETEPKAEYTEENSTTSGKNMSCIGGNPKYDAATAALGEGVRLPTMEEVIELVNKCSAEWTTQNGVCGRLTTGPNGNSIFLPAAGIWDGTSLDNAGVGGGYWSSTPNGDEDAYDLGYCGDYFNLFWGGRYGGLSVRPVREFKA